MCLVGGGRVKVVDAMPNSMKEGIVSGASTMFLNLPSVRKRLVTIQRSSGLALALSVDAIIQLSSSKGGNYIDR